MELCAEQSEDKLRRIGAEAAKRMADFARRVKRRLLSPAPDFRRKFGIEAALNNPTNRRIIAAEIPFGAVKDLIRIKWN